MADVLLLVHSGAPIEKEQNLFAQPNCEQIFDKRKFENF